MKLKEYVLSANTGLDAIKRAPIVDYDTGLKCIRIQDISQNKSFEDWGDTLTTSLDYTKFRLCTNDILVARTGATVGVSYIVLKDYNAVFNNGTIRLKLKGNCNPKFIYYVLQTREFMQYIDNVSCVATQPNLRVENLLRFYIPDLSIEKQNSIVNFLSTYDELIENNNKRIKILEQMAENLYKEWFVRFRFPGHETTEFENGIPKGWMVVKLGNLCEIITGKKDANEVVGVGKYPFFTCARETSLFTDEYILDANAILIAGNGSYTGFVKKHSGRFDLYQRTYALYNFKNIEWLYLYWVIKINFEREFMGGSRGSAIPYITRPNIFNYKVLIPTKDLLIKAQEFFNKVNNECVRLHKANENLIKQRDMLLPRLMSGKLEV